MNTNEYHIIATDYKNHQLAVGDTVKNIESGWRGVIQGAMQLNGELLLICLGVNWWDGTIDRDDEQVHAPADVLKQPRQAPQPGEASATTNFL